MYQETSGAWFHPTFDNAARYLCSFAKYLNVTTNIYRNGGRSKRAGNESLQDRKWSLLAFRLPNDPETRGERLLATRSSPQLAGFKENAMRIAIHTIPRADKQSHARERIHRVEFAAPCVSLATFDFR